MEREQECLLSSYFYEGHSAKLLFAEFKGSMKLVVCIPSDKEAIVEELEGKTVIVRVSDAPPISCNTIRCYLFRWMFQNGDENCWKGPETPFSLKRPIACLESRDYPGDQPNCVGN